MVGKVEQVKKKSREEEPSPGQLDRIKEFGVEVKHEFGKIVWPPKKHTVRSTAVVVVLVVIISLYLGLLDLVLGKLIGFILR